MTMPCDGITGEVKAMNEIRSYMPFTMPVDPSKIITTPDMDLSYALSATLVEWGPSKQPVSGLAKRWDILDKNVYRITLDKNAKWSDGNPIKSQEVKNSLERGFKLHPEDHRSLKGILEEIRCPNDHDLDFVLKIPAKESGLLGKLTEPNYGLLKVKPNSTELDLSVTTGAFYINKSSPNELVLNKNKYWHNTSPGVAETVIIRQPPTLNMDTQTILLNDKWPNISQASSMMSQELLAKYKENKYQIWQRPTDRIFLFQLSPRLHNQDGQKLFQYLNKKLKKSDLLNGYSGSQIAEQIFPRGYHLHDPDFKKIEAKNDLPEIFKKRPLEILISTARVSEVLRVNISKTIESATGIKPKFILIEMKDLTKTYKSANYDFYAGTVGLADPDPEGAMSFYFENDFKVIPSIGEDFLKRLDLSRKEPDSQKRVALMRRILSDATNSGNILPLFNLSTVGLARAEIDLSEVPTTDESVTLSKVRFKSSGSSN